MTLSEVEILMQELGRHVRDNTQIMFGTAVDGRMGNRLSVTIISSLAGDEEIEVAPVKTPATKSIAKIEAAPAPPPPAPVPLRVDDDPVEEESPTLQTEIARVETEPEMEPEPEQIETMSDAEAEIIETELPDVELIPLAPAPTENAFSPDPEPSVQSVESVAPIVRPEPQPRLIVPKKKPALQEPKPEKVRAKQEVLQFEPISRGRFEKSEPTIVEGQDLDVPTFLRKNIRVK
jgi:cell division protein FtsZ